MRINAVRAKGYQLDDFREALLRYASRADIRAMRKDVEEARALRNKAAGAGAAGRGVKVSQNSSQAQTQSEFCLPPKGT